VRHHRLLAAAVMAACCSALVAQERQEGSIRGTVLDKEFEAPVAGAQVLVVETGAKALTSDQGAFVLPNLRPGTFTIVVSKEGYIRQVRADVVVTGGKLTDLEVVLAGDFTDMEEFVVQESLQLGAGSEAALLELRMEAPALMDSVGGDVISKAGASDAAAALRLVSGASVADGKTAVIRGLPDRYVSSQMNGVRLPSADEDKRAVELDQFPAAVIESIQVSKTFTPDQQGDASGGAVDVRLRGIPDEPFFFKMSTQLSQNTNVAGADNWVSYKGGGVNTWGRDDGGRGIQYDNLGQSWDGAVGVSEGEAPTDYKWSSAIGGKREVGSGVRVGAMGSFFYERDSAYYDDGQENSWWVVGPGSAMSPRTTQGTPNDGDFKTNLFDVTQSSETVQWGGLGVLGVETDHHAISFTTLYTHAAEDKTTLAEDTRGKEYFFPGYNPADPASPGYSESDAAPYLRLETLEYTERTTGTYQLKGEHALDEGAGGKETGPVLDWTLAYSTAGLYQPDKRQFGTLWKPARPGLTPALHLPYKPAANFTVGNLQRIYKEIDETSQQYASNLKLPFSQTDEDKGYLKVGVFHDDVKREFDQDSFSNFNDNSSYEGPWEQYWSAAFPGENHPITDSPYDVDYDGRIRISAIYAMTDFPVAEDLSLLFGARLESTRISVVNSPDPDALWYPPDSRRPPGTPAGPTVLRPGDADVDYDQDDVLPAVALEWKTTDLVTTRLSWSQTVARQTFKELTPIIQQEYLGGPIFIGNPDLEMSSLDNYDLRVDFTPYQGGLFSVSLFHKEIEDAIEYVQKVELFDYTSAVNYPEGRLSGLEFETRHRLGHFVDALDGFGIGGNVTFMASEVTLPDDEAAQFSAPNVSKPTSERDMTNTPEYLYNLFLTYDFAASGTQLALFYTHQGDSLIAGAGVNQGNYVPDVYAEDYGTLNLSVMQPLGRLFRLTFAAKNLTNPDIQTVYRSDYIDGDVLRSTYSQGIEYSLTLGMELKF